MHPTHPPNQPSQHTYHCIQLTHPSNQPILQLTSFIHPSNPCNPNPSTSTKRKSIKVHRKFIHVYDDTHSHLLHSLENKLQRQLEAVGKRTTLSADVRFHREAHFVVEAHSLRRLHRDVPAIKN